MSDVQPMWQPMWRREAARRLPRQSGFRIVPASRAGAGLSRARLSRVVAPAAVLGLAAFAVQGCNEAPAPAASAPRVFAADVQGSAKQCTAPRVTPVAGKTTDTAMQLSNDGGWCGISVRADGKPYDAGLLTARPQHGMVLIHTVGDDTRIDYTPDRGYTGSDTFTVSLLPGSAALRVSVTVTPPAAAS